MMQVRDEKGGIDFATWATAEWKDAVTKKTLPRRLVFKIALGNGAVFSTIIPVETARAVGKMLQEQAEVVLGTKRKGASKKR